MGLLKSGVEPVVIGVAMGLGTEAPNQRSGH